MAGIPITFETEDRNGVRSVGISLAKVARQNLADASDRPYENNVNGDLVVPAKVTYRFEVRRDETRRDMI